MAAPVSAFYARAAGGFDSTEYTRGPWDRGMQHAGPPSALLAAEAARASGLEDGRWASLKFDILAPVPIGRLEVDVRVVRPGRRVELLEGTLSAGGDPAIRLTGWRVRHAEVDVPETAMTLDPPPPGPDGCDPVVPVFFRDEIAYHAAFEWRNVAGDFNALGPATVWSRLLVELVEGEGATALDHLVAMADAASGAGATLDWRRFTWVNVDLNVHLEREPEGPWLSMQSRTRPTRAGAGQCFGVLGDEAGRVGLSTQALFVQSR